MWEVTNRKKMTSTHILKTDASVVPLKSKSHWFIKAKKKKKNPEQIHVTLKECSIIPLYALFEKSKVTPESLQGDCLLCQPQNLLRGSR